MKVNNIKLYTIVFFVDIFLLFLVQFPQKFNSSIPSLYLKMYKKIFKLHFDFTSFLPQLSRCVHTSTFRKPYIASLEICTFGFWTVGWLDHLTITMLIIRWMTTPLTAVP